MFKTEFTGQYARLVEVDTFIKRITGFFDVAVHQDDLHAGLAGELLSCPVHLLLIIAVDKKEHLAEGHLIQRIDRIALSGDHVALHVSDGLLHGKCRVPGKAAVFLRFREPFHRRRTYCMLLHSFRCLLAQTVKFASLLHSLQAILDKRQHVLLCRLEDVAPGSEIFRPAAGGKHQQHHTHQL